MELRLNLMHLQTGTASKNVLHPRLLPPCAGRHRKVKQSAPRAFAEAMRQFGVRSDVQARLYSGLYAPREIGLRPAQAELDHKPISTAFSCFVGVAMRHDRLYRTAKPEKWKPTSGRPTLTYRESTAG